ncbi:hypothetical protein C8N32_103138 [Rhodovulum imhoffii]|uniref:Uncharacterized protein n=1 Tax=Rhodovulum imhoffii TaxID=365340 RepID=A0A2T5BUU8_9RHOB|nr:hypothetical protein [Rhodovulum imhoffii]MBK5934894.1 hypothetical protein [Rhodovulum imhoffii]PTN03295.1 hypothetical protein C8N32_103138 [Rhodovulum imhoffii]
MPKFLVSAVAALSLAVAGAAPARAADADDIAKALFGAATLFVIVKGLEKDDKPRAQRDRRPRVEPHRPRQEIIRPAPSRAKRALPGACVRHIETRRGATRKVVGQRCLERQGYRGRLPRACEVIVETRRGDRLGYGAHCLRQKGYRVARH